jgi:hypothetical protein
MLAVNFLVWIHGLLFSPCSGWRGIYPHNPLCLPPAAMLKGAYSHQKKIAINMPIACITTVGSHSISLSLG